MQIKHPYTDLRKGAWLKGNLHFHACESSVNCAESQPLARSLLKYYKDEYRFLMCTEFDAACPKRTAYVTEAELQAALAEARQLLGGNVIKDDLVLLPGMELQPSEGGGNHFAIGMLANKDGALWDDLPATLKLHHDAGNYEAVLEIVHRSKGLVIAMHCNTNGSGFDCELLKRLDNLVGMEVMTYGYTYANGVIPETGKLRCSDAFEKWDKSLNARGSFEKTIFGFAADDAFEDKTIGHCWIRAYVLGKPTPQTVASAIKKGRLYFGRGTDKKESRFDVLNGFKHG